MYTRMYIYTCTYIHIRMYTVTTDTSERERKRDPITRFPTSDQMPLGMSINIVRGSDDESPF